MKKLVLPLLLVIVIALTGCSNYIQIGAVETSTSDEFSCSYFKMTGTKTHTLTVKEGEPVDVAADIKTKKGSIDVYIYMDKDNNLYEGHDIQTSSFTVTLSEPGKYTIKVVTSNHKGGYSFTW